MAKKKKKKLVIEKEVPEVPGGTRTGKKGERSKKPVLKEVDEPKPGEPGGPMKFIVETFKEGKFTPLTAEEKAQGFKTGKEGERPGGFKNVADVLKAAFLPGGRKITADVDNRVFKSGLEYVANNPYATALMLTGLGSIAKSTVATAKARAAAHLGTRPPGLPGVPLIQYAKNTKTARLSARMIGNVMAVAKKPTFVLGVIGASIGTYPWAEWSTTEAMEIMGFTTTKAIKTGDVELIAETMRRANEIYDPQVWEQIGRTIPFANIAVGFNKKFKALLVQKEINDRLMEEAIASILEKAAKETEDGGLSIEEGKEIFQRRLKREEEENARRRR